MNRLSLTPGPPPIDQTARRLFTRLSLAASAAFTVVVFILWVVPTFGLSAIHPVLPWLYGLTLALGVGLVVTLAFFVFLGTKGHLPAWGLRPARFAATKVFYPLLTVLGPRLGVPKERVRHAFVTVNNALVERLGTRYRPDQVLLLLPHCVQASRCVRRLTYDTSNCKRCGECPVDKLLSISQALGVHLCIATGGTIARRVVVKRKPRFIFAVACERDLAEGIVDTHPLPVFGLLNLRPFGPCLDTTLSFDELRLALSRFLQHGAAS